MRNNINMKNKTKYAIAGIICAVLAASSLVLLFPIRHRAAYKEEELDAEAVYKLIFDLKAGNWEGAEREALKLPLDGASLKLLHRITTRMRLGTLTDEETELISAIADNKNINKAIAEIKGAAESEIKTVAENNEKEESDAQKALMRILDNSIKLSPLSETPNINIICLGRENMYAEIDKCELYIRHLSYDCRVGERRLTAEECEGRALSFLLRNMPKRCSAGRPVLHYICETEGCDCFVSELGETRAWIKIRCDTGSVTLFCGYGMEMREYNN